MTKRLTKMFAVMCTNPSGNVSFMTDYSRVSLFVRRWAAQQAAGCMVKNSRGTGFKYRAVELSTREVADIREEHRRRCEREDAARLRLKAKRQGGAR